MEPQMAKCCRIDSSSISASANINSHMHMMHTVSFSFDDHSSTLRSLQPVLHPKVLPTSMRFKSAIASQSFARSSTNNTPNCSTLVPWILMFLLWLLHNKAIQYKFLSWIVFKLHTHTRLMALFSGTTLVSQYQKGKTNLDFAEARDSEWQWHCLAPDRQPHQHPTTLFFTGRMPFLSPNQQHQSTEGNYMLNIWDLKHNRLKQEQSTHKLQLICAWLMPLFCTLCWCHTHVKVSMLTVKT